MTNYKMMTDVEMGIAINSANPWFILFYTPIFTSEWDELATSECKERMIKKIYDVVARQVGFKYLSRKTVRTSVNALVNIILRLGGGLLRYHVPIHQDLDSPDYQ